MSETDTDSSNNSGNELSRRRAMAIISGAIAACWTGAVGAIVAIIGTQPIRTGPQSRQASLGKAAFFDDTYREVKLNVPMRDGWYEQERSVTVFAKVDESGAPHVLDGTCTHLGCTVRWNADANQFQCPCHGGVFNTAGDVVAGPPPKPLTPLHADIRDGEIVVNLV